MPLVGVRVQQIERARIELDAADGHGERDPQLLIQFVEMDDIGAIAERHLIDPADAKELPSMPFARHLVLLARMRAT